MTKIVELPLPGEIFEICWKGTIIRDNRKVRIGNDTRGTIHKSINRGSNGTQPGCTDEKFKGLCCKE